MIENRVIKQDWVELKNLKWIQGNLKEMSKISFQKLITSIIENGIIKSFHVWERPGGELWCLDGNHLKLALEHIEQSGTAIPKKVKADFIDCRDEKHAKELVLIYSAVYAKIIEDGLYEFIETERLEFKSLREQISLPEIQLHKFEANYYKDINIRDDEDDIPDEPIEPRTKQGDLYELPANCGKFHLVMCGDATEAGDVEKLMNGNKADMVFTDPPYGINIVGGSKSFGNIGGSKSFGNIGGSNIVKSNKYKSIVGDDKPFNPSICFLSNNVAIWGANYFSSKLPDSRCWIVWDKKCKEWNDNFSDFELLWTNLNKPSKLYRHKWMGMIQEKEREKRVHPTQKPSELFKEIINYLLDDLINCIILDLFLGSGTTLIACEKSNRICYGMEIEPLYCDVTVQRYVNFTGNNKIKLNGKEIIWE